MRKSYCHVYYIYLSKIKNPNKIMMLEIALTTKSVAQLLQYISNQSIHNINFVAVQARIQSLKGISYGKNRTLFRQQHRQNEKSCKNDQEEVRRRISCSATEC